MSVFELENLQLIYPKVIEAMPEIFDSHDFILLLAQKEQQFYVKALYEYVGKTNPFQTTHRQIATKLKEFPELVTKTGNERNSNDIFGQKNSAVEWRKVKK